MYKIKTKNGFTLVELLAVIVVLAIIGVIAVTTVSEVLEQASINSFKSSNDILIKEIKRRIGKNKLGLEEPIACLNYGENNCTDMYDLSKEDYALSINDLGNENYDIILVGKGTFDGIDLDGNGNCILYTNINNGIVTTRPLEKVYANFAKMIVNLEENLPNIVKTTYDIYEGENLITSEEEYENFEFAQSIRGRIKNYADGYPITDFSIYGDNFSYDYSNTTKIVAFGNLESGLEMYNGEPLFDNELFYYSIGMSTNINISINYDKITGVLKVVENRGNSDGNILLWREKKLGYKSIIRRTAEEYFLESGKTGEVTLQEIAEGIKNIKDFRKYPVYTEGYKNKLNYIIENFDCKDGKIKFADDGTIETPLSQNDDFSCFVGK